MQINKLVCLFCQINSENQCREYHVFIGNFLIELNERKKKSLRVIFIRNRP